LEYGAIPSAAGRPGKFSAGVQIFLSANKLKKTIFFKGFRQSVAVASGTLGKFSRIARRQ
jgi:hypothetical protein